MESRTNYRWQDKSSFRNRPSQANPGTQNTWNNTAIRNVPAATNWPILLPSVNQPMGRQEQRPDWGNNNNMERRNEQLHQQARDGGRMETARDWQPQSSEQADRRGGNGTAGTRTEQSSWNNAQEQENRRIGAPDRPTSMAGEQNGDVWGNVGRNRLGSKRVRNVEESSSSSEEEEREPPSARTRY